MNPPPCDDNFSPSSEKISHRLLLTYSGSEVHDYLENSSGCSHPRDKKEPDGSMKYAIPIPASNATSIWRMKKIIYNESIHPNVTVKTPASSVTRDLWEGKGISIGRKRLHIRSSWQILHCGQLFRDFPQRLTISMECSTYTFNYMLVSLFSFLYIIKQKRQSHFTVISLYKVLISNCWYPNKEKHFHCQFTLFPSSISLWICREKERLRKTPLSNYAIFKPILRSSGTSWLANGN